MACSDPSLKILADQGYCVVSKLRSHYRPLQILGEYADGLKWLGELATIMAPRGEAALPTIQTDPARININGEKTGDLSLGLGLSLLSKILGALGGSSLGLEAKYQQASSIIFQYLEVMEDYLEPALLDKFLAGAEVHPGPYAEQLLEADELYVITSTLKSQKVLVEAKKSGGGSLELKLPEIKEIVGGHVKVSGAKQETAKITYEGALPVVFGFQAFQLFYEDGHYQTMRPLEGGEVSLKMVMAPTQKGGSPLRPKGTFAQVRGI